VSLAREFVDEESARFANGVLQQCWERAAPREPGPALDPPIAP
jgi:transcription termination factor NusB